MFDGPGYFLIMVFFLVFSTAVVIDQYTKAAISAVDAYKAAPQATSPLAVK